MFLKKTARLMVLLLVAAAFLSSCGTPSGESSGDAASPSAGAPQTAAGDSTAAGGDSTAAANTPAPAGDGEWTNLSWQQDTSPVTFSCYIDMDWYALDTWGKDHVSQEITKRTGVSLDVTKASDQTQLNVLLASGDYPEIVFTDYMPQRFEDPDISHPWDELIPEHCPEFLPLIDPVEILNNTTPDGHFYTLKTHYADDEAWNDPRNLPSPGSAGLYLRTDLMEKLGNPPVTSIEQLHDVFRMAKEKSAELGIDIVYNPHPTWTNPIAEFMGLSGPVYMKDGTISDSTLDPYWKDYFLFLNELVREGIINKEAFTVRPEDFFQRNRSGKVFAASYNSGLAGETNKIFDENGIAGRFDPVTTVLTYKGEERMNLVDGGIGWASCFITTSCKNPQRAIRYMEFLKSPEGDRLTQWGIEGMHYTLNDEGLVIRPEDFNKWESTETGIGPWYFQASGLAEGVTTYSSIANPNPTMAGYAKPNIDLLKFKKPLIKRNPVLYFARVPADSEEYMIKMKVDDEWRKRTIEAILAPSAEEATRIYDELMRYIQDVGIDKYNAAIDANYKAALERYKDVLK